MMITKPLIALAFGAATASATFLPFPPIFGDGGYNNGGGYGGGGYGGGGYGGGQPSGPTHCCQSLHPGSYFQGGPLGFLWGLLGFKLELIYGLECEIFNKGGSCGGETCYCGKVYDEYNKLGVNCHKY